MVAVIEAVWMVLSLVLHRPLPAAVLLVVSEVGILLISSRR